ncbi:putative sulfate exporter family transporter [Salinibacterium sp. G-O1]|uniref:YeiH family protein n=1 Tax=Salinibacterium sp. G-O1 TaxID=3046208 RepID=UPI0024B97079|nr:putative sulfate exporter family transporter [Salinibacterium sp. G-O1]MDJ0335948.1 putative sulfate exporter family transporter [Salinibacterium sp. G-O1]
MTKKLWAVLPGLGLALAAFALASLTNAALPWAPTLTVCVVLGVVFTSLPWPPAVRAILQPGLATAARRLLRIGIVLLGLKLSLVDIAGLGWLVLGMIVLIVIATFLFTLGVGKLLRLPGDQPLLIAAGFSICGASAIGAMSGVTRSKQEEQATPIALVTLCGTLAIALLPALQPLLGLDAEQFGMWTGASVHDVGQVVATAQIAGASALAIAIVVKLTRVAMLAPMVAITGLIVKRDGEGKRPPLVPLFLVGFIAAVLVRTFVPVPDALLQAADTAQLVLLGMALFGLGAAIRVGKLIRTGARPLAVAAISWVAIAAMSLGAVAVATAAGVPALR